MKICEFTSNSNLNSQLVIAIINQLGGWNDNTRKILKGTEFMRIPGFITETDIKNFYYMPRQRDAVMAYNKKLAQDKNLGLLEFVKTTMAFCQGESQDTIAQALYGARLPQEIKIIELKFLIKKEFMLNALRAVSCSYKKFVEVKINEL